MADDIVVRLRQSQSYDLGATSVVYGWLHDDPSDEAADEITCLRAEVERLKEVCKESNEVCACECPASDHESYGENGECCGVEGHECIRTSRAVFAILTGLRSFKAEALAARHLVYADGSASPVADLPFPFEAKAAYAKARAANEEKP